MRITHTITRINLTLHGEFINHNVSVIDDRDMALETYFFILAIFMIEIEKDYGLERNGEVREDLIKSITVRNIDKDRYKLIHYRFKDGTQQLAEFKTHTHC